MSIPSSVRDVASTQQRLLSAAVFLGLAHAVPGDDRDVAVDDAESELATAAWHYWRALVGENPELKQQDYHSWMEAHGFDQPAHEPARSEQLEMVSQVVEGLKAAADVYLASRSGAAHDTQNCGWASQREATPGEVEKAREGVAAVMARNAAARAAAGASGPGEHTCAYCKQSTNMGAYLDSSGDIMPPCCSRDACIDAQGVEIARISHARSHARPAVDVEGRVAALEAMAKEVMDWIKKTGPAPTV